MEKVNTEGQRMPLDLFLVRHGHSEGNLARELFKSDRSSEVPEQLRTTSTLHWRLTNKGGRQASLAGEWLRTWMSLEGMAAFDRYYCSPYARAMETARGLDLPAAQWQLEPLLRERDYGLWEGQDPKVSAEEFARNHELKDLNKFLWRPESGESMSDLDLRVREMLATFARELSGARVVCVTHEDVMEAFRFRLEKLTITKWLALGDDPKRKIANGGILHYTRLGADGAVHERFQRVRLVDPSSSPDSDTDRTEGWSAIERPRFDNHDLDELIAQSPRAWDPEQEPQG